MKKFILLGTSLCLFFIPVSAAAASVITEVFANPADEDRDEMIEIYNPDPAPIDLTGFTLTDGDALDALIAWSDVEHGSLNDADGVRGSLLLPSQGFALLLDTEYAQGSQPYDVPAGTLMLTTENTTLGNGLSTTDPVSLMDAQAAVVSTYGTPQMSDDWRNRDDDGLDAIPFNPGDAISAERIEASAADSEQHWQASLEAAGHSAGFLSLATEEPDPDDVDPPLPPTPPNNNPTPPTPPAPPLRTCSTEVKINELLPNPEGSDELGEFIELSFSGSAALSLEGWTLSDSSGRRFLIPKKEIGANGYLLFDRPSTGIALNNTGEEVVSLNCGTGGVVDEVRYTGPAEEGWSWSKTAQGFAWSVAPTPGQANMIKVANTPPNAVFSIEGTKEVDVKLTFDASASNDVDGDRLTFAWEFGDKETAEGKIVSHAYGRAGSMTVRLTVSDGNEEEVLSKKLTIENAPHSPTSNSETEKDKEEEEKKSSGKPTNSTSKLRTTSSSVLITELLPNPEGPDAEEEWIELTNFGDNDVDLSGWMLTDEKTSYVLEDLTLRHGERVLIERPESKISLNNSEDHLYLIDGLGKILHGVAYVDAKKGWSFSRKGETSEWAWTQQPTANEENQFSVLKDVADDEEDDEASAEQDEDVATPGSASSSAIPFVSFKELQALEKGTEVEVRGTVVNLPGERGVQKLYIKEGEQELQIYSHQKKFPALNKGDEISVFGSVSEAGGEKRVNIRDVSDIRVLNAAPVVPETSQPQVAGVADEFKPGEVDSTTLVNPALAAEPSEGGSSSSGASPLFYWGFGLLVLLNAAGWFWFKKFYLARVLK